MHGHWTLNRSTWTSIVSILKCGGKENQSIQDEGAATREQHIPGEWGYLVRALGALVLPFDVDNLRVGHSTRKCNQMRCAQTIRCYKK